ncbi:MAG: pyridoxal-phosphate dependent enzyme [Pirellulaceae bacterium]
MRRSLSPKVTRKTSLGAEVAFRGADIDAARQWICAKATDVGDYYVAPTDRHLICGVGTYGLEIMESLPDVDTIIVPVGAGSGACGVCIAAKSINSKVEVIAAQLAQAPAMQLSWTAGKHVTASMNTFAEGVASGRIEIERSSGGTKNSLFLAVATSRSRI